MRHIKFKKLFVPVIYGVCVVAFLCCMFFVGKLSNKYLFKNNESLDYVDDEIIDDNYNNLPVINTDVLIVKPYLDESVFVYKTFYDIDGESTDQEKAIIFYEDTYMQNSGVDYASKNEFDIISILDGTVISVYDNEVLGTSIEIRHSNDIISVYQCLSNVLVKEGDTIIQGQKIATSGASNINRESENNLHFELYYKGSIVNPENYYNKSINEL